MVILTIVHFNCTINYWHFLTYKSINKIDSIQKRVLQLLHNDFESNYSQLLDKAKKSAMTIVKFRCLCLEMYKTVNHLNPFLTNVPISYPLKTPENQMGTLAKDRLN